ncbi:MAG: GNAT family N-acetyltransferase [Chloroflexota bacterium]|nr:GNAT family N-acetyltransferase [Chloroflexota bacterium]
MKLTLRMYQDEDDYWRIRDFLRQVFLLNDRQELSWHVARLDYWWWRRNEFLGDYRIEEVVFIWETADGRIAAALNPESKGQVFQQVHPGLRTPELEEEMLVLAEKHLAISLPNGKRKLWAWADEQDNLRQDILTCRGYTKVDKPDSKEYQRRRSLDEPILEAQPPPGYTVRSQGDVEEHPARGWVSWKVFHPDEPDDDYGGWDWFLDVQCAPLYRRDLDIVAVAPGGEYGAFSTIWYDDVTRTAYFEPVGTAPEHQRLGLGKAVMCEGLRRLKRMGATMSFVGSYTPPAHALYASVGFTEYNLSEPWVKEL